MTHQSPLSGATWAAKLPDPLRWVRFLEERKSTVDVPRHRAMIDMFIEHLVSEYEDDFDRTMDTIADDGAYRTWGGGLLGPRPNAEVVQKDAQRRRYDAVRREWPQMFRLTELDVERFHVGDDGLAMDGMLSMVIPGKLLVNSGSELPDGGTVEDMFLVRKRHALFFAFDEDGRMRGEEMYFDTRIEITRIEWPPS